MIINIECRKILKKPDLTWFGFELFLNDFNFSFISLLILKQNGQKLTFLFEMCCITIKFYIIKNRAPFAFIFFYINE